MNISQLEDIDAIDDYVYRNVDKSKKLIGFHVIPYNQAYVVLIDYENEPRQYFGWFVVIQRGVELLNKDFGLVSSYEGLNVYQRNKDKTYP